MSSACWRCQECGFTYDEGRGWPADGLAPGTLWEDIPDHWLCPGCGIYADFAEEGAGASSAACVMRQFRRQMS